MKPSIKFFFQIILIGTVLLATMTFAVIQDGPGEAMAMMEKKAELYAAPNKNHEFLHAFTGHWNTKTRILQTDAQNGTATASMILGGRFLEASYSGNLMGIQLNGKTTLGYDNYKKKFTFLKIDNLNTSILSAEGTIDHTGKVLSLWGTVDDWMTDEQDKPVMYRYRIVDQDTIIFEVHDLSIIDGETKVIEIHSTRSSKQTTP